MRANLSLIRDIVCIDALMMTCCGRIRADTRLAPRIAIGKQPLGILERFLHI